MENQSEPGDADLRRFVLRNLKQWTTVLGAKPAEVPVWQFPLRAFEIVAEMAGTESDPHPNLMSAELCLELLAYTPIRLRSSDGVEIATNVAQLAVDAGVTLIEAITDFENDRDSGELSWEQEDADGVHVYATYRSVRGDAAKSVSST